MNFITALIHAFDEVDLDFALTHAYVFHGLSIQGIRVLVILINALNTMYSGQNLTHLGIEMLGEVVLLENQHLVIQNPVSFYNCF